MNSVVLSDLNLIPGKHCLYSSLYNIFRYQRYTSLSEYGLFFLCNGISFKVNSNKQKEFRNTLLGSIEMDYIKQVRLLSERLKVPIRYKHNIKATEQVDMIQEIYLNLSKEIPILVFLKSGILKYHILENPNENLGAHSLIVYGIDWKKQSLLIADSFITNYQNQISTYKTSVSFNDFFEYLIGYCVLIYKDTRIFQPNIRQYIIDDLSEYLCCDHQNTLYEGFSGLKVIIHELKKMTLNRESETDQEIISVIFMIKSYILMTIPYFEYLLHELKDFEIERNALYMQSNALKNDWTTYLLCLLSLIDGRQIRLYRIFELIDGVIDRHSEYLHQFLDLIKNIVS